MVSPTFIAVTSYFKPNTLCPPPLLLCDPRSCYVNGRYFDSETGLTPKIVRIILGNARGMGSAADELEY